MRDTLESRASAAQDGLRVHRWAGLRVNSGEDAYCIKALLPRPALALIYGASGSGKTFLSGRAALDVSTGRSFLGMRTRRGRVAYLAAESPRSVIRRFAAWRDREGIADAALIVIDGRINLLSASSVDAIVSRIEAEGGASLIVIDTAAQAAPGMDENTSGGMGQVIAAMERLRDAFGACVVIVHHAGKDPDKGARGWSGLRAAVDVEVEVRGQKGTRTAHVQKVRDGEIGREINFDLLPFVIGTDEDGDPATTCEVVASVVESMRAPTRKPRGANQPIVLDALRQAIAERGERHSGSSVIPAGVMVVTAQTLERYALPRLQQTSSGRNSAETRKREALNAALRSLEADAFIGTWNDLRWTR